MSEGSSGEMIKKKRQEMYRIGVVGTGFIAKGLVDLLTSHKDYVLSGVLTRTNIRERSDFPHNDLLTNSIDTLIRDSDLIVECSGDVIYATDTIDQIVKADIPVVTMNSEFHITTGSYFIDKGLVTEAEGDQPGALAILHEEAMDMGFTPLVYGNIKGFLNHNPTMEDMEYWSKKSQISLGMVTSFTDGTKVQIEQALVANGLGAAIIEDGLLGMPYDDMAVGGNILASKAKNIGKPVSDYLLSAKLPAGVFIVVEHSGNQQAAMRYFKMGDGPYYVLERTYHLCHLEILKTIKRVLSGGGVLLDNSPAEGDQPGALAILHEEAMDMGFTPLVYGNIKGFLNHNPTMEDMEYWSKKSQISLGMVTSFTDGTKVQIEQALVANGLGAAIIEDGLLGMPYDDMAVGGNILASKAKNIGKPVSDYLLSAKLPAGVFIVVEHSGNQQAAMRYFKMGDGPYYVLERTYHLCHLEILKTIKRVLSGGGVLLDNSPEPRISVAAIAKRDLKAGEKIEKGIGSFDVRGVAVTIKDDMDHIPIGLVSNVTLRRDVSAGERLSFDDLELPDTLALRIWKEIIARMKEK